MAHRLAPALALADDDFAPLSLDMGSEKWIDVDGIRTRYFDEGSGPAVVFFHGSHCGGADGASATIWDMNFAPLSRYFNVIAVDRLGQGFTDNPLTDGDYTMDASVKHAARFLQLLGKGPYHLVGHSRGGYLVARLALEHPDLAASCNCVSSGTLSPGIVRNHIVHANLPGWDRRAALRAIYERYSYNPRIVTTALLDECEAVMDLGKSQVAVRKFSEGLETGLYFPELGRQRRETQGWLLTRGMPCPTLIVWGYRDPTAVFENGRHLIEMFMAKQRNTSVSLFNRSGHFVYREYAAQFNRRQYSFVMANS
jgi:pimeloyl-ACP methyl ester carboxylesterase